MSSNREIASFPFRPHLAKYLWFNIRGQVIETPDLFHKRLDIDLRSNHGQIIRLLFQRANFPGIDEVEKGFRLYVSIPKRARNHSSIMEDGQCAQLVLPQEAIDLINNLYEEAFRSHFHTFVCGYVHGNQGKRYSVRQAIELFMEKYDLLSVGYSYEQLEQFYKRTDSPVKKTIYAKKKPSPFADRHKKPSKYLIDRQIKR